MSVNKRQINQSKFPPKKSIRNKIAHPDCMGKIEYFIAI